MTSPWKPADYYYCWWGFGDLPDLNFDLSRNNEAEKSPSSDVKDAQPNIALVNYLLDATEYWLKDADVDGVRLDVPNEVPFWFWKLFNAAREEGEARRLHRRRAVGQRLRLREARRATTR